MATATVDSHAEFACPDVLAHYPEAGYRCAKFHRDCKPGDGETAESCSAKRQLLNLHEDEPTWTWEFPQPDAGD